MMNDEQTRLDDIFWMKQAWHIASVSPDISTQTGAVVVRDATLLGIGCNTFPRGVEITGERLQRPLKYDFTEHAERNAIFDAGSHCEGATMYALWAICADCARSVIQSGISELVAHSYYTRPLELASGSVDWVASIDSAFTMLDEAGVNIRFTDVPVYPDRSLLFLGEPVSF